MIISNNYDNKKINLVEEKKQGIRDSADNLDKRYKENKVSLESLKKITKNYAKQQEILNRNRFK